MSIIRRLEIFYPLNPKYPAFQKFGENLACIEDLSNIPITKRRVVGKVNGVCPIGYVELYPLLGLAGHSGEDLYAYDGQPIYASQDGKVVEIETEPERGLGIGIITTDKYYLDTYGDHYIKYRNWHLKTVNVTMGQIVKIGDLLGLADSTGLSSGPHNHFEIKPIEWRIDGSYYNVFQNNGFFGSISPELFWSTMTAFQLRTSLQAMADWLKKAVDIIALLFKK